MEYYFPVYSRVCIYRIVAQFGNKKVEGIVKEKSAAQHELVVS
jgi:hypothetical protein